MTNEDKTQPIKIYLLCYNRNEMLKRAVLSLINQTFNDWTCELHCDKPDNTYPKELLAEIIDPRIVLCQHERNLGLTQAFNIPFQPVKEKYISILEEDNWWAPNFLAEMFNVMEENTACSMAWANMRVWNLVDGRWIDTRNDIWDLPTSQNIMFSFPHVRQLGSALHSQGSMLVRMIPYNPNLIIPDDMNSGALEAIRERAFGAPILFVSKVLGNYAMLEESHRPKNNNIWSTVQLCLITSFFEKVRVTTPVLNRILNDAREGRAKSIHVFLLSKMISRGRSTLSFAKFKPADYLFFSIYYVKHPLALVRTMKNYRKLGPLRKWLTVNTKTSVLNDTDPIAIQAPLT